MKEDEIAKVLDLNRKLGPGLLETVYEVLLANMVREQGLEVERQKP